MSKILQRIFCPKTKGILVQFKHLKRDIPILHHASIRHSSSYMKAWQMEKMGGVEDLKLENVRIPRILRPNDILVEVYASSVNPLDTAMIGGYGNDVISGLKSLYSLEQGYLDCNQDVFPFIGGRDFSGKVVSIGHKVEDINVGDRIYGVVSPQHQGAHSEYVVTPDSNVAKIPDGLSYVDSAAIPYAALTAWSAAVISAGILPHSGRGQRVLVIGASGGVGSFLVQILNAWGVEVSAVCSSDSFEMVSSLGAYDMFDYNEPDTIPLLTSQPRFDAIIDASGRNDKTYMEGLKKWVGASYVSLTPPLLRNIDQHGIVGGGIKSFIELLSNNYDALSEGRTHKWAFYMPNPYAFKDLNEMITAGKIKSIVNKKLSFEETPIAYQHMIDGPNRGKIVIEMKQN